MPTINDLRQQAATIKNATQVGENTATRVGTTFETIADLLEGMGGVTNLSTIDIGSIDTLNTTGDMLVGTPNIYTLTKTIGANTFKVGTLFQFANNGRYDVAQVIVSQFIVDGNGRIDTTSADQEVHIFYRLCKTMNGGSLPTPIGTWTTWTELGGSGGSGVTIDPYPTQNSQNAVSSGGVFERLQDIAPKVDISAIDDIDEYTDMLSGVSPFYEVTKTISSNTFRIGTLMEFANQGRYILYQILATDYVLNDDGTLDTTLSENGGLKLIWRMKQFSGNPPAGVTIGVWSAWSYLSGGGAQPDNEDIDLNANDQLQFANKAYDASAFSGLGRVYLRKNIVTSGGVDKNVLTAAMVSEANTIYHIQYDYDLNGQTITLPAGCVLEFDGGSLANGEIVGNQTKIVASQTQIFKNDLSLSGSFDVANLYIEWFGGKADGTTYNNEAFQSACNAAVNCGIPIQLLAGTYIYDEGRSGAATYINFSGAGQKFAMRGAGMGQTIIKTADGSLDRYIAAGGNPKWLRTFYVTPYDGRTTPASYAAELVEVSDLTFDKNKNGNISTPDTSFAWESNCSFRISAGDSTYTGTIENVYFRNIEVKNKVASGLNIGNATINKNLYFDNIVGLDGPNEWGTREDIYPLAICPNIQIMNCNVYFIQIEPVSAQITEREDKEIHTFISNSIISEFEWNGSDNAEKENHTLIIENSFFPNAYLNISGNVIVSNCVFRMKDKNNSILWANIQFNNCQFYFDWVDDVPSKIIARTLSDPNRVEFSQCKFETLHGPTDPSVAGSILDVYAPSQTPPIMAYDNCSFKVLIGKTATTRLFNNKRGYGWFEVRNCTIDVNAEAALFAIGNVAAGYTKIVFENNDVVNNNIIANVSAVNAVTLGKISGNFNRGDIFTRAEGTQQFIMDGKGTTISVDSSANVLSFLLPKGAEVVKDGVIYTFMVDKVANAASTWAMFTARLVNKNVTTAERQALTLPNVPIEAFDTDLQKTVYWNGTEWLDSTAAPVTNSLKLLSITQSAYDALATKDPNTLYVIS